MPASVAETAFLRSRISRKELLGIAGLCAALAILLGLPQLYLLPPNIGNCDFLHYTIAYGLFSDQFWAGDWYPRWLTAANAGMGTPLFITYYPLAAYFYAFTDFLPIADPYGVHHHYFAVTLALFFVFLSHYCWLRQNFTPEFSRRATWFYAFISYFLIIIYHQAALVILLALIWGTLLLLFTDQLRNNSNPHAWIGIIVSTSLLILSHVPTATCLIPFVYIYALRFSSPWYKQPLILKVFFSQIAGVMICAFYWIPLIFNKAYTHHEWAISGKFNFRNNFFSFYDVVFLPYILLMAGVLLTLFRLRRGFPRRLKEYTARWAVILAGVLFLVTPVSIPVWEALKPLQYLQFPMRLYTLALLPFGFLMALLWRLKKARFTLFTLTLFAYAFNALPIAQNQFQIFPLQDSRLEWRKNKQLLCFWEYVSATRWMPLSKESSDLLLDAPNVPEVTFIQGEGRDFGGSIENNTRVFFVEVVSAEARVQLKSIYHPALRVTEHSNGLAVKAIPLPSGLTEITLPRGRHTVLLDYSQLEGKRAGYAISLISVVVLIGFYIFLYHKQRNTLRF